MDCVLMSDIFKNQQPMNERVLCINFHEQLLLHRDHWITNNKLSWTKSKSQEIKQNNKKKENKNWKLKQKEKKLLLRLYNFHLTTGNNLFVTKINFPHYVELNEEKWKKKIIT